MMRYERLGIALPHRQFSEIFRYAPPPCKMALCVKAYLAPTLIELAVMSDVTRILSQIESGDPSAADKLLPLVYVELRKLAAVMASSHRVLSGQRGFFNRRRRIEKSNTLDGIA